MEAQVTLRIPGEMQARVQALARRLGLRRSQVVRMALQDYLARMEEASDAGPFERVIDRPKGSTRSRPPGSKT